MGKCKRVLRACTKTWIIIAWCNWGKNEGEDYKRSLKNAAAERLEEKQKLHRNKTRSSRQSRLESRNVCHKPGGNSRKLERVSTVVRFHIWLRFVMFGGPSLGDVTGWTSDLRSGSCTVNSVLPVHALTTSSHSVNSPLSPSITPSLFHSRLKTYLFHKSFPHRIPSSLRTDFTTGPFLLSISVLCF